MGLTKKDIIHQENLSVMVKYKANDIANIECMPDTLELLPWVEKKFFKKSLLVLEELQCAIVIAHCDARLVWFFLQSTERF